MSDIRLSMREFRFLEEKRKLAPLTQAEEQRWIELGRTLGIFDLTEANPDDVAEVDPNDVVLVEPLAQNFEWVLPVAPSVDSTQPESAAPPAQATTASPDPPASGSVAAQSESAPVDQATSPAADTTAEEGDTWNGNEAAQDEQSPVIDLSASDATPGVG